MSATRTVILGSSSPPVALSRRQSDEQPYHETLIHSDASLPSPSVLLKLAPRAPPRAGPAPLRSGSRAASVPTRASGFCTASAFAKENGLGIESTHLNLQKYVNDDDSTPALDTKEDSNKKTGTRKRTSKKEAEPKLKLDKKPTERKSRKKKEVAEDLETGDIARPTGQDESTTITSLQTFEYKDLEDESNEADNVARPGKLKSVARKPRKDVGTVSNDAAQHPATREATPSTLQIFEYKPEEQDIAAQTVTKPKPKPRKPRAKKSEDEDNQAKLPKAKVTKPRARKIKTADAAIETHPDRSDVVQLQAPQGALVIETAAKEQEVVPLEDLALELATRRRRDWTPPPVVQAEILQPSVDEEHVRSDSEEAAFQTQQEGPIRTISKAFLDLQGSFGYNEQAKRDEESEIITTATEPALKKRRVEVIKATSTKAKKSKASAAPKAPKAPKAPPKSARTVTGIALAQFKPAQADAATSISSFFAPNADEEAMPDEAAAVIKATKRKRSRSPAKRDTTEAGQPKSRKSTKKVTIEPPPELLSPGAVQKRMEKQDILFGTSSQLVRDESPTFIREIQQAIKESESQLPTDDARNTVNEENSARPNGRLIRATRGLWSAGARGDEDMVLLSPEILAKDRVQEVEEDLEHRLDVEEEPVLNPVPNNDSGTNEEIQVPHIDLVSSDPIQDVDKIPGLPQSKNISVNLLLDRTPPSAQPSSRPNILQDLSPNKKLKPMTHFTNDNDKHSGLTSLRPIPATRKRARSSSPLKRTTNTQAIPIVISSPPAKSPARSRFLEKSNEPAEGTAVTTEPPSSPYHDIDEVEPIAATTKHPSSPYQDIDEIEDSEQELTSSPPRRRSPVAAQATLELSPAPVQASAPTTAGTSEWASAIAKVRAKAAAAAAAAAEAETEPSTAAPSTTTSTSKSKAKKATKPPKPTASQEAANQTQLFALITRAVTTAPPGRSLKEPSWYEKMLLYDPIVLEDLAAWLNGGVLRTVAAAEEENGDETGKKGERDGDVDKTVEWKVEEKVLQKWCEENSICCLWRGGLRGGVKARY